jgi:hypothetical protein
MEVQASRKSVQFIFDQETGGKDYYNKYGLHPNWPKGASGITIGAGWDSGYHSYDQLVAAWKNYIPEEQLELLKPVMGLTGQKAVNALTSKIINGISVPFEVAFKQFTENSFKGELALTIHAFPKAEELNPDTIGVLTSIVYNRGTGMNDHDPKTQERKEMRLIKMLVPQKDYKGIADQIISMKRLWDGVPDYAGDHEQRMKGLLDRRDLEALMVLGSKRQYDPSELLTFSIN